MNLATADKDQLVQLIKRYNGVNTIGEINIVTHVCNYCLGIRHSDEAGDFWELIGEGTLKECMSLRNAEFIRTYCDEQVFEFGSVTLLNMLCDEMDGGVLDCILVNNELKQLWLRGETQMNDETEFYTTVLALVDEVNGIETQLGDTDVNG